MNLPTSPADVASIVLAFWPLGVLALLCVWGVTVRGRYLQAWRSGCRCTACRLRAEACGVNVVERDRHGNPIPTLPNGSIDWQVVDRAAPVVHL